MKTTTLPDKPSALIRVALEDMRAMEEDTRYRINMGVWRKALVGYVGQVTGVMLGPEWADVMEAIPTEPEQQRDERKIQ
jgi:hypothetical protein